MAYFFKVNEFLDLPPSDRATFYGATSRAKQRAKKAGSHAVMISRSEFVDLWNKSEGVCEVTKIPFSDHVFAVGSDTYFTRPNQYPYTPSLDQIEAGKGYAPANCRLVLNVVNTAANSYSSEILEEMVLA